MNLRKLHFLSFIGLIFISLPSFGQITITTGGTALQLAQKLVGQGITVFNATLNNAPTTSYGTFNFNGNPSEIGIDSGIVLTDGSASQISNASSFGISNAFPAGHNAGDPDLNIILSQNGSSSITHDACVLEFDFVPAGDSINFDYVFASDEYPEWACSSYTDVFAFLISGPGFSPGLHNIALVPGTSIPVAVNSINNQSGPQCSAMGPGAPFSQYYVDNSGDPYVAYDGFTTVLTAKAAVQPCDTYHLKIAIADAGDDVLDSGVFLKAGSLNSIGIPVVHLG